MLYKISGKLWLDGSGRVSVTLTQDSKPRVAKVLVCLEDKNENICDKLSHALDIAANDSTMLSQLADQVLATAQEVRQNSDNLLELEQAMRRAAIGAEKSRVALMRRVRALKEEAFKKAAADLMDRGLTRGQLFQLIREAIVEGVHER
jgi:hypothetical protein